MKKIQIYTDGACSVNPGVGGWGAVLIFNNIQKKISGGEELTTNNRMELMAVISALNVLKEPCSIEIFSDSAYVINAFQKNWIYSWQINNWQTADKKPVSNKDLWEKLLVLLEPHKTTWNKVKGHSTNELNNLCDEMARTEVEKIKQIKQSN
ncbi:MAG: ribonuclease HI [Clostridia bacterium]